MDPDKLKSLELSTAFEQVTDATHIGDVDVGELQPLEVREKRSASGINFRERAGPNVEGAQRGREAE